MNGEVRSIGHTRLRMDTTGDMAGFGAGSGTGMSKGHYGGCHSPSMAPRPKYIHQLPYSDKLTLCRLLDADRKWSALGGVMLLDPIDIKLFANAPMRDKSPSEEVLDKYGEKNGTINQVFVHLFKIGYVKGMHVLKSHTDSKYWYLLDGEHQNIEQSSELLARYRETPTAPPYYQSGSLSKLQPDSRNVNTAGSQAFAKNHPSGKLPSPSAKPKVDKMIVRLPKDGMAQLSLRSTKTAVGEKTSKVQNVKIKKVEKISFQDADFGAIQKIAYEELDKATEHFREGGVLGKGGFGTVYKGKWNYANVAVKMLHVKQGGAADHIKQSLTELKILEKCRFTNILNLYGISIDGPAPCLVYEFMPNGSLDDWLRRKHSTTALRWSQRLFIAKGTASGLHYLHTMFEIPLVHGDVKPANILLDINLEPKLGDFGLTREGPEPEKTHKEVSHVHGTRYYLPHEYLQDRQLSTKVDVYSFGIVFLELATNLKIYDERRKHRRLTDHVTLCEKRDSLRDSSAGEDLQSTFELFINKGLQCAHVNKKNRPEINEVLQTLDEEAIKSVTGHYSREPTATVNQKFAQQPNFQNNINTLNVAQSPPNRFSPTDNLQAISPTPPPQAQLHLPPGPNQTATSNIPTPAAPPTSPAFTPSQATQGLIPNAINDLPAMSRFPLPLEGDDAPMVPCITILGLNGLPTETSSSSADNSPN